MKEVLQQMNERLITDFVTKLDEMLSTLKKHTTAMWDEKEILGALVPSKSLSEPVSVMRLEI